MMGNIWLLSLALVLPVMILAILVCFVVGIIVSLIEEIEWR